MGFCTVIGIGLCVLRAVPCAGGSQSPSHSGATKVAPASWTAVALHRFSHHPSTSTPRRKRQRAGALQDLADSPRRPPYPKSGWLKLAIAEFPRFSAQVAHFQSPVSRKPVPNETDTGPVSVFFASVSVKAEAALVLFVTVSVNSLTASVNSATRSANPMTDLVNHVPVSANAGPDFVKPAAREVISTQGSVNAVRKHVPNALWSAASSRRFPQATRRRRKSATCPYRAVFSSPREHGRSPPNEPASDSDGDEPPAESGDESPHSIALQGPAGRGTTSSDSS